MRYITLSVLLLMLLVSVGACHHSKQNEAHAGHVVQVRSHDLSQKYHFQGKIQPLKVHTVSAPVDGVLTQKNFQYGQKLNNGSKLGTICSQSLAKSYRHTLSEYLKDKNKLNQKRQKYQSDKDLKQAGIISQNKYQSDQSAYRSQLISLADSRARLKALAQKLGIPFDKERKLKLQDTQKVRKHLQRIAGCANLYSHHLGVALFPEDNDNSDDKTLHEGSQLEKGEAIVAIGQRQKLKVDIKLSELSINQLEQGQKANIKGLGFDQTLKGHLTNIAYQAKSVKNGIASFPATVVLNKLTKDQRQAIRVGMTAKVTLPVKLGNKITVPVGAVWKDQDQSYVMRVDKHKKRHAVTVSTGAVVNDQVVIKQGLKSGQQVVVYD